MSSPASTFATISLASASASSLVRVTPGMLQPSKEIRTCWTTILRASPPRSRPSSGRAMASPVGAGPSITLALSIVTVLRGVEASRDRTARVGTLAIFSRVATPEVNRPKDAYLPSRPQTEGDSSQQRKNWVEAEFRSLPMRAMESTP